MANAVYKFYEYFGRMGELTGIFVADEAEIQELIGKEIYYGECLGKHSEVIDVLTEKQLTLITKDPQIVDFFIKHDIYSGVNPLWNPYRDVGSEDWIEV